MQAGIVAEGSLRIDDDFGIRTGGFRDNRIRQHADIGNQSAQFDFLIIFSSQIIAQIKRRKSIFNENRIGRFYQVLYFSVQFMTFGSFKTMRYREFSSFLGFQIVRSVHPK